MIDEILKRFSDRARKAMQLANNEALKFNNQYVHDTHIILGIIKSSDCVANYILKRFSVDLDELYEAIVKQGISIEKEILAPFAAKLPFTAKAASIIEEAYKISREERSGYVGTQHILIAMMKCESSTASIVISEFGLSEKSIKAKAESKDLYNNLAQTLESIQNDQYEIALKSISSIVLNQIMNETDAKQTINKIKDIVDLL